MDIAGWSVIVTGGGTGVGASARRRRLVVTAVTANCWGQYQEI